FHSRRRAFLLRLLVVGAFGLLLLARLLVVRGRSTHGQLGRRRRLLGLDAVCPAAVFLLRSFDLSDRRFRGRCSRGFAGRRKDILAFGAFDLLTGRDRLRRLQSGAALGTLVRDDFSHGSTVSRRDGANSLILTCLLPSAYCLPLPFCQTEIAAGWPRTR